MSGDAVTPAGWPADLAPPGTEQFADQVTGWLLDRGPGEWRLHAVLRRHPRALARLLVQHLDSRLTGLRHTYGAARRELAEVIPEAEMSELLAAIEADGALTAEILRQVQQVDEALAGRRWRDRL